jgi:hypothetical protein
MKNLSLMLLAAATLTMAGPTLASDIVGSQELINRPNMCSQLESSVGLRGAECGTLSLNELAKLVGLQNGN